jgi:hypothetical protein
MARAVFGLRIRRKSRSLLLPVVLLGTLGAATVAFVSYVLWPTWPKAATSLDAPAIPLTVAGVLFNVPPAAIRAAVQRQPGAHERIDLVFLWPSLTPPQPDDAAAAEPILADNDSPAKALAGDRVFVTIASLGAVFAPLKRLQTIYPRYFEANAAAGQDGLAVLPFRAGTPYEGEDLVYIAENPEQFFARCTRAAAHTVPATCIHERLLGPAEITLRFPRLWLDDWRSVIAGFDRLVGEIHPHGG